MVSSISAVRVVASEAGNRKQHSVDTWWTRKGRKRVRVVRLLRCAEWNTLVATKGGEKGPEHGRLTPANIEGQTAICLPMCVCRTVLSGTRTPVTRQRPSRGDCIRHLWGCRTAKAGPFRACLFGPDRVLKIGPFGRKQTKSVRKVKSSWMLARGREGLHRFRMHLRNLVGDGDDLRRSTAA